MIKGIGVDLVEISRIELSIKKYGEQFLQKVFTDLEIRYCSGKAKPSGHFAARFAAKEAVAKALSTGWAGGFRWKDVEVSNDTSGKPSVTLKGELEKTMRGSAIFLSLSHSETSVVAFAIIEGS